MALSYSQEQKFKDHLSKYSETLRCIVCGSRRWGMGNEVLFQPVLDVEFKQPVEGRFAPYVTATCGTCHNTLFFSAIALEIVS